MWRDRTSSAAGAGVAEDAEDVADAVRKRAGLRHDCNIIEAPWLVNGGHGASLVASAAALFGRVS
jgi:hypothetical protein